MDAIVEGSVIREGNHIRVHAQLIRGVSDEHFWSETYDRDVKDLLALQADVAQSIAQKVEVTVSGEEEARLRSARSVPPEVYENYLKGRFALDKGNSKAEYEESIGYFEKAIQKDPTFAPAYVGLANTYFGMSTVFIGVPPETSRPKAMNAVRKALELDPDSVETHVLLAEMLKLQWQWGEAESEYQRALELNPSDAAAHLGLAHWLLSHGLLDEALAQANPARELDPLAVSGDDIGWILFVRTATESPLRKCRGDPTDVQGALWYPVRAVAKTINQEAVPVFGPLAGSNRNRVMGIRSSVRSRWSPGRCAAHSRIENA